MCPQCGTLLIDATPAAESRVGAEAPEVEIEMVCVLRTADEGLASLVKSMFDGDAIRYVVRGEGLQDLLGWGRVGGFNYLVGRPSFSFIKTTPTGRARSCRQKHQAWRTRPPSRTTIR